MQKGGAILPTMEEWQSGLLHLSTKQASYMAPQVQILPPPPTAVMRYLTLF